MAGRTVGYAAYCADGTAGSLCMCVRVQRVDRLVDCTRAHGSREGRECIAAPPPRAAAALPVPELDALRMLAVRLRSAEAADGGPIYHRLLRRRDGETEGMLVSSMRKEHFGAAGRIAQVSV